MKYITISDWESTLLRPDNILETSLSYEETYSLYSEFVLNCYKRGEGILARDFVTFLNLKGHKVRLISLEQFSLSSNTIEDELAEEIQAI